MKRLIHATLFVVALAAPALAQYSISRSVIGSGAARITSGDTMVRGTVGQAAIGIVHELSGQQQQVGFWYVPLSNTEPIGDSGQYALLAINSLSLNTKSEVRSGFVGVNEIGGPGPFLGGSAALSVGVQVVTAEDVELSGSSVSVANKAEIKGVLHYLDGVDAHRNAVIADSLQETADFWPLVELPTFRSAASGSVDVEVKKDREITLSPEDGPFATVSVKSKGRLVLSGGEYHIENLDIGSDAEVEFLAPTTLLIADKLSTGTKSNFGPASGLQLDAADILVYVAGFNGNSSNASSSAYSSNGGSSNDDDSGDDDSDDDSDDDKGDKDKKDDKKDKKDDKSDKDKKDKKDSSSKKDNGNSSEYTLAEQNLNSSPKAVSIGVQAVFRASVYVPNGTLLLGQKSEVEGGFIGLDVEVGEQSSVSLNSGWENGAGVIPVASSAAKVVAPAALATLPEGFGLDQNFPNPFNPSTAIRYSLAEMADVKLSIYNMLGQQIRVLVRDARPAGVHTVEWDGRDAMGRHVATGLYFYRIEAGQFRATRKMTITK